MIKSFKFRIYPTKAQELKLLAWLRSCRFLYNSALEERISYYKTFSKSRSFFTQANLLSEIKDACPEYKDIHSQVLQDVLKRLDKTYQSFFRRIKSGDKPGFPRFKGSNRYNSFTFPQSGFRIEKSRLHLSKIGAIKLIDHRIIDGEIKTCSIIRTPTEKWFVCFSCEINKIEQEASHTNKIIGIDLGVSNFITTSDNVKISPEEKFLKKYLVRLQKAQQRKEKFSGVKRRTWRLCAARIHEKITNSRHDWQHKVANRLIREYNTIIVENLSVQELIQKNFKNMRRSISDAAWSAFIEKLCYKAECAGKIIVKIDPRNTSKMCCECSNIKNDLELKHRIYKCDACGLAIDRDYNAALNIKNLGMLALKSNHAMSLGTQAQSETIRSLGL